MLGKRQALVVTLVAVALLLAAGAVAEPRRDLEFTAVDAGGDYGFELRGSKGLNPDVVLHAGEEVWVDVHSAGRQDHNLRFAGPIGEAVALISPGQSLAMRFTVPDEPGAYAYWCDPHRELGMGGTYHIREEGSAREGIPALPVAVVALALSIAAVIWRLDLRERGGGP